MWAHIAAGPGISKKQRARFSRPDRWPDQAIEYAEEWNKFGKEILVTKGTVMNPEESKYLATPLREVLPPTTAGSQVVHCTLLPHPKHTVIHIPCNTINVHALLLRQYVDGTIRLPRAEAMEAFSPTHTTAAGGACSSVSRVGTNSTSTKRRAAGMSRPTPLYAAGSASLANRHGREGDGVIFPQSPVQRVLPRGWRELAAASVDTGVV